MSEIWVICQKCQFRSAEKTFTSIQILLQAWDKYTPFVAKRTIWWLRAFCSKTRYVKFTRFFRHFKSIVYCVITRYLPNILYISLEPFKKISLMRDHEGTTQGYLKVNDIIWLLITWQYKASNKLLELLRQWLIEISYQEKGIICQGLRYQKTP